MRKFLIAATAALIATTAQAQSFGGLKSLRDLAKAAQGATNAPKAADQAQPASAPAYEPIRSEAAASYAAYRNRVTLAERTNCDQVASPQPACIQSRKLADMMAVSRCQETFGYDGSYATEAQRDQAENTMAHCAALYDKDATLASQYANGKSVKTGKGAVSSF